MKSPVLRLALCLLFVPLVASADERILSFFSEIEVHTNGSMTVTEIIRVRSEQDQIRRGIYRDFPTRYKDRHGNRVVVAFDVTSVTRDGKPDNYALEDLSNGERVRIGREEVILPSGEHTYLIKYRTNRQLGYFEDYDELYWNVTGNEWGFPIDEAGVRVRLPDAIPPDRLQTAGYTGPEGSTETAYSVRAGKGTSVEFAATRPLGPGEGLTIAVSWPKGHVHEPTRQELWGWFVQDNRSAIAALVGLGVILGYYVLAWAMVGIDPRRGTIIPRFRPPEKVSPAAARFVWKMGFDHQCFAASLIHLAVQGRLRIKEVNGTYTLVKVDGGRGSPFAEEVKLRMNLFDTRSAVRMSSSNHETFSEALETLEEELETRHLKHHFLLNRKYWIPGIVLWIVSAIAAVLLSRQPAVAGFMTFWLSFWTLGVVALVRKVFAQWKKVFTQSDGLPGGCLEAVGALFLTVFSVPFLAGEGFGLFMLSQAMTPVTIVILAAAGGSLVLFHRLLKAPTLLGRRLTDELEGFRMYLSVAERDRLASMRSPEKTPELFEAYLPYALALDVEQAWAEQFSDLMAEASEDGTYDPTWYSTRSGRPLSTAALAGSIGNSLTSATSSSSKAPGSSSGSGGGGSSGGGGGGGGGGGW